MDKVTLLDRKNNGVELSVKLRQTDTDSSRFFCTFREVSSEKEYFCKHQKDLIFSKQNRIN